ncbi:hypothetical protein D3C81_1214130 [compost metagenome]
MVLPYSTRLTVPLTISPTRSLNSSYWLARSASRTFPVTTWRAIWVWTRPNSNGGRTSTYSLPTSASGSRFWASRRRTMALSLNSSSSSSGCQSSGTMVTWRVRASSPVLWSILARMS